MWTSQHRHTLGCICTRICPHQGTQPSSSWRWREWLHDKLRVKIWTFRPDNMCGMCTWATIIVPNATDAAISLYVVGTFDNVWGKLRCQSVPVHGDGTELAWSGHLRLQLEGPAVCGGHCYVSTTNGCRWCEPRLLYLEEMWCLKVALREGTNALNRWNMGWWSLAHRFFFSNLNAPSATRSVWKDTL
jgi:hypothetical protein